MKKKEIFLSLDILAKMGASEKLLEFFKERYPNDSAPISEVLRELQELSNTDIDYGEYVEYAIWLVDNFPPTQEPLVLNKLTGKFLFWNGDIDIYSDVDGEYTIIGNGDLNIKGDANLTDCAGIWAKKVKAKDITLFDDAEIWANGNIDAVNITAAGSAGIDAKGNIDAVNIEAYVYSAIDAEGTMGAKNIAAFSHAEIGAGTIDAEKIAAKGYARIWAKKINTQNIMQGNGAIIRGEINLIQPSSN